MSATVEAMPQHLQALAHANTIRCARSALKRQVYAGTITATSVILDPPDEALTMTLADLLGAQRRWGAKVVSKFLAKRGISEARTVGALTERQRRLLVDALGCPPITRRPCFPPPHAEQPRAAA